MFRELFNLYNFFDRKSKNKILITQFFILCSSIFEILAIFTIGPLVQILNNPNIIYQKDELISKLYNYLDFSSFESFLMFVVFIIFCFLLISTILQTLTIYILSMFSQILGNTLRVSLFKFYISQEWLYHSKSNSTTYVHNVLHESNRVTQNLIFNLLVTNSKVLTGALIILFLMIYNLEISIVCLIFFGLIYGLIFWSVKIKINIYGKHQSIFNNNMLKTLNETFYGIKETILYGNKKNYYDQFNKAGLKFADNIAKINFFGLIPRNLLEFFAFSLILLFILFLINSNEVNFNTALPSIAIFVFAGYKLLPIFQNIYYGAVQIKSTMPALLNIKHDLYASKNYHLENKNKGRILKLDDSDCIKFKDVSFFYQDSNKKAVKKINLSIKKNSLNFIVGPSGSGKSTLLDLILGLIFPQNGEIKLGKENLSKNNNKSWHQNIGYVGQNIFLFDDTIKNNICLHQDKDIIDEQRLNTALELSYVNKFLKNLPNGINSFVGEKGIKLSGGQRQRVAIARALYQDKGILILDEATASLDGIAEKYISDQLKQLSSNRTIIMVTHNVKLCKSADCIYLLNDGLIKETGNFEKLKKNELFLELLNE